MAYSKFPIGSQWRKWDLHMHSPMSGMANGFPRNTDGPDWDKYVEKLETITDIPVIGVTDYFLIEGYKKLREFRADGKLTNIDLLLPNIEFRLDQIVGGKRINFHVIFSDQVSVTDIEDHFLSNLDITIEGSPWQSADLRKFATDSLRTRGQGKHRKRATRREGCHKGHQVCHHRESRRLDG